MEWQLRTKEDNESVYKNWKCKCTDHINSKKITAIILYYLIVILR